MIGLDGVCTSGYDPGKRLFATGPWAASIRAIHPGLAVRVAIRADAANHLDYAAYGRALGSFKAAGIRTFGLLDLDFNRPWLEGNPTRTFTPDEALGYGGNQRQNRWIKDSCVRAWRTAVALRPWITDWIVGNEGNLLGLLPTGRPPIAGPKAPALNPDVYYSYGQELAGWLISGGATSVTMGALSWLPFAGDDDANPYDGAYLAEGLSYLAQTRAGAPKWSAMALNCEGVWSLGRAQAMAAEVAKLCGKHHLALPLTVGEWGWQNGNGVDPRAAAQTYAALSAIAPIKFFFQHPADPLAGTKGYALTTWTTKDGGIYPLGDPVSWTPILANILHTAVA